MEIEKSADDLANMYPETIRPIGRMTHSEAIAAMAKLATPKGVTIQHRKELINQQYGSMYRPDLEQHPIDINSVTETARQIISDKLEALFDYCLADAIASIPSSALRIQRVGRALRPTPPHIRVGDVDGSASYEVHDQKINGRMRYVTYLFSHGMQVSRLVSKRRKIAIAKGQDWLD